MPCTFPLGLVSGTVQIAVRVDPDRAARPVHSCRPDSVPRLTEWSPPSTTGTNPSRAAARNELGDPVGRVLDLREKAGVLVTGVGCLCDRGLDVAQVHVVVAELPETRCQPRVANRRRTHVNAATTGAEVERGTDHCDFATWWLKRHGEQG